MSYGAQFKFGIARQSAGGPANVVVAPTSYHGFAQTGEDIGLEKDELISQNLIGKFEEGAVYDGINKVLGTISFEVTPRNLHAALAAAVNYAPGSVSSAALRNLTFLPNTQDYDSTYVKPPFSVYAQFTDAQSAETFYDCQFGGLELNVTQGEFAQGKLILAGGARVTSAIGSMAVMPDAADVGLLYPWNVASISWGGNPMPTASDMTIKIDENIDALYTVNASVAPFKFTRTAPRQVTVNGTFYMTSRDLLNDFAAGTQRQLLVTMMNTRTAIQSGYFNYLKIDIPNMKITAFKPAPSGPGEVSVNFTGRGVVDPTSGYAIQFLTITTWAAGF
jgi:hypothetical protein